MQDIVKSVGKIPRKECLELQFTSDMLVLSTWNNKGEEGVFPGKFLLQPMVLVIGLGLTGSCSIPRHMAYSQDLIKPTQKFKVKANDYPC